MKNKLSGGPQDNDKRTDARNQGKTIVKLS